MKNHTLISQTQSGSYWSRITYRIVSRDEVEVTTTIRDLLGILPSGTDRERMTVIAARRDYRARLAAGYQKA